MQCCDGMAPGPQTGHCCLRHNNFLATIRSSSLLFLCLLTFFRLCFNALTSYTPCSVCRRVNYTTSVHSDSFGDFSPLSTCPGVPAFFFLFQCFLCFWSNAAVNNFRKMLDVHILLLCERFIAGAVIWICLPSSISYGDTYAYTRVQSYSICTMIDQVVFQ